ncbi:MAG: GerMN domain-containing protein [Christensenellaceae bacterium]|nr:GerMN domain-containing protein [Christensenellaceae bacterium]
MKMHRSVLLKGLLVLLALLLFGCGAAGKGGGSLPIHPVEGAISQDTREFNLYFASADYESLINEGRQIDIPANSSVENAVCKALIAGPAGTAGEAYPLINTKTRVVSVAEEGDVLLVTLSKDFLDWSFFPGNTPGDPEGRKRLAVYSLVNTMVEASGVSRVQLLVDMEDSGTGQRIRLSQIGFEGGGVLEPLGRNSQVVLTPANSAAAVLGALASADLEKAYGYIHMDEKQLTREEFVSALAGKAAGIDEYTITEVIPGADGNSAVVMVDYSRKAQSSAREQHSNIPLQLIRQQGAWKVTYSSFMRCFAGDAA